MNKNKVAILTAAGTGIGADAAKQLASDGFNISILSSSGN
jgi:NAD(P)-dependent dehydrogenase (short-subunit alcohol dehydrogenase family)